MGQIISSVALIDNYGIEVEVDVRVYYRSDDDYISVDGIYVLRGGDDYLEVREDSLGEGVYQRLKQECYADRFEQREAQRERDLEVSRGDR